LNIKANRIEQQKNNTVESFRRFNGLGGFTHFMDQELKKSVDYDGLFKKAKTEFTENLVHRIHIKSFLPEMLQVANEIQRNIENTQKIQKIKEEEQPIICMTYHLKNGNDVMIKANNTTVWRNEKLYEIKQKDIFVNIVEGIFFDIEKE